MLKSVGYFLKSINIIKKIAISLIIAILTNQTFAATQLEEKLSEDIKTVMQSSVLDPLTPHLVFSDQKKADAWLSDMSNRLAKWVPDPFLRKRYLTIIQYEATRADLDPQLILSLITVESKFNKYAISSAGARGMMQVMPFWQIQIGNSNQSLFDVETNLRYGCTILRYYLQKEHGDMDKALARYNGSINQTWYPNLVHQAYDNYWTPAIS